MRAFPTPAFRLPVLGIGVLALAACQPGGRFDPDLRRFGGTGLDTAAAASQAAARPAADARGIISYPGYQVAVARRGDTVDSVAARIGVPAGELASHNAIAPGTALRDGEVLALPRRVAEPSPLTGAPVTSRPIDVATIASSAIDRAGTGQTTGQITGQPATPAATGVVSSTIGNTEPIRHRVMRGETAYSVARLYNVNVKALADWNGLGPDLAVREGQTLLIPVATAAAPVREVVTAPGQGSPTPTPPSAAKPLPAEKTTPVAEPVKTPPAADLGAEKTAASGTAKLAMPVAGKIIRGYSDKTKGIDIAAPAGTPVTAAGAGQVVVVTTDTKDVTVVVVRHEGNLLTVYANIGDLKVQKGDRVKRGQPIATIAKSDAPFLRFSVSEGMNRVDPVPYLQ